MNESFELTPTRVRELRAFAASARLLNFSQAAREVGCTPSVLSRRIASLEAAVGARLFLRTTRRVALTARGEQLLVHCDRLDAVLGELAEELQPQQGGLQGRLRIHLPRNYGIQRIAALLARFMVAHPAVRIDATYDDAYADLVASRVDLAVRAGRLVDSQLVARRVGTMRRYLCATPAYLEHAPPLRDPADLKAHRCLAFSGLRTGTLWQFTRQRQRRSVRIEPVLQTNDSKAIRDAVLAGVGIGVQGDYMGDPLITSGELVEVLPDWQLSQSPVHLVWLPGADRVPAVRTLIDFLARELGGR
ncbi:LysR family transcriptional regulator [Dyella lutea]|uniref:LysR family transcriptional regulator n=1 Tax=Dyella lutea TaxID=2950441 RepID=A0ABT1F9F4_9GAMM|nr:LysR family transcriptional regulator [Dyella lutea]MCP1374009.1 LysR family transcriptional regulator [Dyella lutea]